MPYSKLSLIILLFGIGAALSVNGDFAAQEPDMKACGIEDPLFASDEQIECLAEPFRKWVVELKTALPESDADAQIKKNVFRLLQITHAWIGPTLPGIKCFIDWPEDELHGSLFFSDAISGADDVIWRAWANDYVTRFNQAIIKNPAFIYRDVCEAVETPDLQARDGNNSSVLSLQSWLDRTRNAEGDGTLVGAARLGRREEVIEFLNTGSEDVNARDIFGLSALDWSILRSDNELTATLLHVGATVDGVGEYPITPLYLSIALKNLEATTLLLEAGADPNKASAGMHSLQYFSGGYVYGRPLGVAVQNNVPEIVGALLAAGADIDSYDGGEPPIFAAIENEYSDILKILIDAGANVMLRDRSGLAPIQTAAERNNYSALKLLVESGGAKAARSEYEQFLWEEAYKADQLDILNHVVAFGTNTNLATRMERRNFSRAINNNDLKAIQIGIEEIDHRANTLIAAIKRGDLHHVRSVYRGDIVPLRNFANSELSIAVQAQQAPIVQWLLRRGANPDTEIVPSNLEWLRPNSKIGERSYFSKTTAENRKPRGWLLEDEKRRKLRGTVFTLAFQYGPLELTKAIVEKSKLDVVTETNKFSSPLESALFGFRDHKDIALVEYASSFDEIELASPKADYFLSQLCFWTMRDNIDAFQHFLDKGYLPHQEAPKSQNGVNFVRRENALNECIRTNAKAAIQLLEKGADPNQRSRIGNPALHQAIERIGGYNETYPYEKAAEFLLIKGADAMATYGGENAFDLVQRKLKRADEGDKTRLLYVVKLLAEHGLTEPATQATVNDPYPIPFGEGSPIPVH